MRTNARTRPRTRTRTSAGPGSGMGTVFLFVALAVLAVSMADEEKWWHNGIIYQIYPRSFMDLTGDGVGDIKGITSKLDYLADLGVTAVWLSPIYTSPQADFGYDISNFTDINPEYGTLDDFDEMVKRAKELGLKVVLDLVPNHSSDEHPWFIESVKNPSSKYGNYYNWHPGKEFDPETGLPKRPNNWNSVFRYSAWEWNEERKAYYYHAFHKKQPDLNYNNPDVVEEMKDVYRFWMDRGVEGFRVDAIPYLFEQDGYPDAERSNRTDVDKDDADYYENKYMQNLPKTYDMVQQWQEVVTNHGPKTVRLIMTEAYATLDQMIEYYGSKDKPGADFTFNFQMITQLSKSSNASDFKKTVDEWMGRMDDWRWPNWVIGNHDNKRVATRFPNMEDGMNMISMTLPGTVMTYNGEELGMSDPFISFAQTKDPQAINKGEKDYLSVSRDPCRTPIQWDDTTSAGFSSNRTTWMPVNPDYWELNVKNQKAADNSHLHIYKGLAQLRKTETFKKGNLATEVVGDNVLKIVRSLMDHDTYVVLVNVGSFEETLRAEDIGDSNFKIYVASLNSKLKKGDSVSSGITLRPKASVVLTNGVTALSTSLGLLLLPLVAWLRL